MAHCPPEVLADLLEVFEVIKTWPGIRPKGLGTFYFKSTPFLHFHHKDNKRWADVREGKGWREVPLKFNASATARKDFLKTVRRQYEALVK